MPLNKDDCSFCQKSGFRRHPLHKDSTKGVGENLESKAELSKDNSLKVHLNTVVDPTDAQFIDVQYLNNCRNKYVYNVRKKQKAIGSSNGDADTKIALTIKFLRLLDSLLADGNNLGKICKAPPDFCS